MIIYIELQYSDKINVKNLITQTERVFPEGSWNHKDKMVLNSESMYYHGSINIDPKHKEKYKEIFGNNDTINASIITRVIGPSDIVYSNNKDVSIIDILQTKIFKIMEITIDGLDTVFGTFRLHEQDSLTGMIVFERYNPDNRQNRFLYINERKLIKIESESEI